MSMTAVLYCTRGVLYSTRYSTSTLCVQQCANNFSLARYVTWSVLYSKLTRA